MKSFKIRADFHILLVLVLGLDSFPLDFRIEGEDEKNPAPVTFYRLSA